MRDKRRKTLQELLTPNWESVKSFEDLLSADERYAEHTRFGNDLEAGEDDELPADEASTLRSYTINDHHARFALLSPPGGLPLEVNNAFAKRAINFGAVILAVLSALFVG